MNKGTFLKNTAILTAASLALRGIGMVFRVYLAGRIGAQGMGLYQLITTVYNLFLTVATAGIGVAATRIFTEELSLGAAARLPGICRRLLLAALSLGIAAGLVQFASAGVISEAWLKDPRAAASLRILALSLPPVALSGCLQGYFMARRSVALPTAAQLGEQLLRMAIIIALLPGAAARGIGAACAAVVLGGTAAEFFSAGVVLQGCRGDLRRLQGAAPQKSAPRSPRLLRRLWAIAAPVAATRYVGSILRTIENVMVPGALAAFCGSRDTALAQFGALRGMAMAVLFFPFSFLATLSTLLLPEITEAYARRRQGLLDRLISRTILITLTVSVLMGGLFTLFASQLGELLYHDAEVALYIRVLGPVMPFMYLESVVDGVLKGLDQQLSTFRYSVWDSLGRILLIALVVPRTGMPGFLGVMILSNLFTGTLNLRRLLKVTGMRFCWGRWLLLPSLALAAGTAAYRALYLPWAALRAPGSPLWDLLLGGALVSLVYLLFLFLTGGLPELSSARRCGE